MDGSRQPAPPRAPSSAAASEEIERERAAAESARRRFAFLAEASRQLAESLEIEPTLQKVARLCLPDLADCSAVILAPDEGALQQLAIESAFESQSELTQQMRDRYRMDRNAPRGIAMVLKTGKSAFIPEVTDGFYASAATDEEGRELLRRVGFVSFLCVPLIARGRTLGTLTLGMSLSGRRFNSDDLVFAEEMGRRAGQALDNARLYAQSREAIRLREQFLAIASHELKTPMTSLSLGVESLDRWNRAHPGQVPEIVATRVEGMLRQVGQLRSLVSRLLDVSQLAAGRLPLQREVVELGALAETLVAQAAEHAARAHSSLSIAIEERVEGVWDRFRVEQIVTNLLDNALKYGAGRPVFVRVDRVADMARVAITDEGIGIALADQERIFRQFERAVPLANFGGFGLGLWICRLIAEAHGGRIDVESAPGAGATFRLLLPALPDGTSGVCGGP
jgi:signal transduction histidine kinase